MTKSKYGIALLKTYADYTDLCVHVCRRTPDNPYAPKLHLNRGDFHTVRSLSIFRLRLFYYITSIGELCEIWFYNSGEFIIGVKCLDKRSFRF